MWDWAHFKSEGWLAHTKRSAKFAGLLLLSGVAMVLHLLVPFWQQPGWLCANEVACALCEGMEKKDD
tara:strand:+ start:1313 stop:1513 length:201 start_codon:yes stop_codon:yes gene_type:complete